MIPLRRALPASLLVCVMTAPAQTLSPALKAQVDQAAESVLKSTGVPSASVGIIQNGRVVMTAAYGKATLMPEAAAQPGMKYAVGSITKQFTAVAVLLLAEDGKLTLDDPVAKYFPDLTQAADVTLRNLLTHTSGYEDYAPQDYTIPAWTHTVKPLDTVNTWAKKPLDFQPGTRWQYSNTNFVLAALIVEKVSGMPYMQFFRQRMLKPLHLIEVIDLDTQRDQLLVTGYSRNALGPLRVSPLEAPGWYYGDGSLAMPVGDLLLWDQALLKKKLLRPESYAALTTEMKLKDGSGSHYGLGVFVGQRNGHRSINHSGEVSGFVAENDLYPDDQVAIAVLTNQEASSAASSIADAIASLLLPPAAGGDGAVAAESQARAILAMLQHGAIDTSLLTSDAQSYFTQEALSDFATSLGPLGPVTQLRQASTSLRGGMVFRAFRVAFGEKRLVLTTFTTSDGKLEQFLIGPAS